MIAHLPPQPIPLGVILSVVVAASTDLTARRVPNLLIASGLVASLAVQLWLSGPIAGFMHWIEGVLTGFALLFPVYLLGGTAAGDVKLLMLVGAWIGPDATLSVALMTFLFGGCWVLALVLVRGRFVSLWMNVSWLLSGLLRGRYKPGRPEQIPGGSIGTIPYAASIAAGTLVVLCNSI
ncbi:MAG TPA: prepilin peptidase [Paraburkholderia sp.]|nr:prepilin peptidase [Paraburkholderia sp.]